MNYPQLIDLHMHTNVSDGTDTPEEILLRVKEAGLELFSVTDHDAVKGCQIIEKLLADGDPRFVSGVEFSCKDKEGQYHILGYGYDPEAESVHRIVELGHSYRMNKVLARLVFLKSEFGFSLTKEERTQLLGMDNPGKPHIGNLMVKHGFAQTKDQAIKQFINKVRFPDEYVRPEEAIQGILMGGGIPVLAHPSYGNGDQLIVGEEMDRRLRHLMDFGLQGVEAFYSGFTAKLHKEIMTLAERYGLFITAGSDYHGTNKLVTLGDIGSRSTHEWPEGMRKFLDSVRKR